MGSEEHGLSTVIERFLDAFDHMPRPTDFARMMVGVDSAVRETMGTSFAAVYRLVDETQELETAVSSGPSPRLVRIPLQRRSLAGRAVLDAAPQLMSRAETTLARVEPGLPWEQLPEGLGDTPIRDAICAPLRCCSRVIGAVQVANRRSGRCGEAQRRQLDVLGRIVGLAVCNARLQDDASGPQASEGANPQFMRMMIHELKSPVASARTLVSGLRFSHGDDPKVGHALDRVVEQLDGLLSLIGDVLALLKVRSGQPLGPVGDLDLAGEVTSGCRAYAATARTKGLKFAVETPDEPMRVRIDHKGFQLVLANLVSNAVRYTMTGSVRVVLRRDDGWARLAVSDTGIGIPHEEMSQLFTEFYRGSNARARGIKGSGVGLAAVKHMVERFEGRIDVESEPGRATTFIIHLPLAE